MKIYTRTGDKGETSLIYGQRVPKNDKRVEAYGTCDEANSMIGLALSYIRKEDIEGKKEFMAVMERIQTILFHVGAELATPKGKEVKWKLTEQHITELEAQIDKWEETLPPLTNFILPSGTEASAALHSARSIVRRAERTSIHLLDDLNNPLVVSYLNRLSDFLFVAARYINKNSGGKETTLQADV